MWSPPAGRPDTLGATSTPTKERCHKTPYPALSQIQMI
jgi:hypothetical protein